MRCKKCGAEIPEGYVFCSACGAEVQLVPDYNLLDEDILSNIIQKEANAGNERKKLRKNTKSKTNLFIWGGICSVLMFAVLTLFIVYQVVLERHRNSYDYQYQKAEEYFAAGDFTNAIMHYEQALELRPRDKKVRKQLLAIYLETEDTESAVSILKELIAENKSDKELIQQLIEIYDKNEEYDEIHALCEEVKSSETMELFADYLVDQPKFSNISGTYTKPLEISIISAKGYDIFYTLDERDPILHGKMYRDKISLKDEGTTVIMAATRNEKGIYSQVVKATYTICCEPPDMPKVTPVSGTYNEPQMITIQVPADCTAYYTWDGSDPTESSMKYTGPLEMPQGNQVLSVVLVNSFGLKSRIFRVNYVYMP